jgi:predicted flap endonuclease-1-like 5' DNA nuclease
VPKPGAVTKAAHGATLAAANPCTAESLRKRADEIADAAAPRTTADFVSMTEALVRFEQSSVIPAMRAAVAAGATPDDLNDIIALGLQIERQAALLGVPVPNSILSQLAAALKQAMAREIAKCAAGSQGPLRTLTDFNRVARSIALIGGGETALDSLRPKLEGDCLSKPYLLSYSMTTDERLNTSPRPPGAVSGRVFIDNLPVPVPRPGQDAVAATGPMSSSDLTCDLGAGAFAIACVVNPPANVDLEAKIVDTSLSTKKEQRCGRTVEVPVYKVVIQLRHPTDQEQETITFHFPPAPPFAQPATAGGGFDRALSVATEGELQQVTLPDDGGQELLLGSTDNFHGSMLKIFASGTATLKLK